MGHVDAFLCQPLHQLLMWFSTCVVVTPLGGQMTLLLGSTKTSGNTDIPIHYSSKITVVK